MSTKDLRYRPSPAAVLRLIRDRQAVTLAELAVALGIDKLSPTIQGFAFHQLKDVIRDLGKAKLVTRTGEVKVEAASPKGLFHRERWRDDVLGCTELLRNLQEALGLSLQELSQRDAGALVVEPFFGRPLPPKNPFDVFVVMPFREALRRVFEGPIKAAAARLGLSVGRGDDFFSGEPVMAEVWSALFHCKAVVADCTGRNANVFYEVGMAHTIGKPVILLAQALGDVPFDLLHVRTVQYAPTPEGLRQLEEFLSKALLGVTDSIRRADADPTVTVSPQD